VKPTATPCAFCYSDKRDRVLLPEVGWVCVHRLACFRQITKDRDDLKVEVAILKEKLRLLRASKRKLQRELESDADSDE